MNFESDLFDSYFFACGFLKNTSPEKMATNVSEDSTFDVSSLTKALVTGPQIFDYYQKNGLDLKTPFKKLGFLKPFSIKLRSLNAYECLRHEAGLPAWKNFFTQSEHQRRSVLEVFSDVKLTKKTPVYSDLGFILMAQIKEIPFKSPSFENLKTAVSTGFSAIRQRILKGEVHDDNAYAIEKTSGFAGHAGLFLTGNELISNLQNLFLNKAYPGYFSANAQLISEDLKNESLLGLRQGGDDAAKAFFAGKTMGHYGFTGCAFWVEPKSSAYVVLLTNRVAKSFSVQKSWKDFRAQVFDYAYQNLQAKTF